MFSHTNIIENFRLGKILAKNRMKYRVSVSSAYSLRSRSVSFKVVLLDNTEITVKFERKKVLGSELFQQVCDFAEISSLHQKYFGLRYINSEDAKSSWLSLDEVIKSSLTITATFQLAIKVFPRYINDAVDDAVFLRNIVYQIKDCFQTGKLRTSVQEHAVLDSYFAQGVLGDFNSKRHTKGYLERKLGSYFYSVPCSLNTNDEISAQRYERMVTHIHQSHTGLTSRQAFKEYLRLSMSIFGYGAFIYKGAVDLHDKEFILAISLNGIQIFLPDHFGEADELVQEFSWGALASIMSDGSKFLFSVWSRSTGKRSNSLETHSFKFAGHFGHLQAQRIVSDAVNHRTVVLGPRVSDKREKRSKSVDDISRGLERMLPGRQIDPRLVQSFRLHNKLHGDGLY